ncbi:heavy-metal-associated domain-containing protein [Desemzia sp. RIT804]|uniref:heavy-metal-associated domain-containing protein n=1 Tax=Desemzia sp. RIT 804 TaxID=2810209 RepID=UPI0019500CA8|nr:heavy metal-associated domain-containing protein [Desemzia sp. RIT 804]MBM6616029.1 heavy-metal-associated domain-containing protein [Desemzia sp. RIT 804]
MRKEITIEGMKCEGCANTVKQRFLEVEGVNEAVINLETKSALIQGDVPVNETALRESLAGTNYSVVGIKELDA